MNDLISVIVPVYNVEKYLNRCVRSIKSQSYDKIEIILVDDGSTDTSGKICEELKKNDKRIKVFHKKNGGLSDARNFGINKSIGNYIVFVDSDDYLPNNSIEILYNCLTNSNSDISCGDFKMIYNNEYSDFSEKKGIQIVYKSIDALKNMMYMHALNNSACCKMYKKELFNNIKYPVGKLYEDLGTTYKLFLKSNRIVDVKTIVYYYFQNDESIMHYKYSSRRLQALDFAIEELEAVKKECPHIISAAKYRIFIECMFIWKDMPLFHSDSKKVLTELKIVRKGMLRDKNLYLKQKLLCLISYFGHFAIKIVYKIK